MIGVLVAIAQPDSLFTLKDGSGVRSLEHWISLQNHKDREKYLPGLESAYHKQQKPFLEHFAWFARRMVYVEKAPNLMEVEKRLKEIEQEAHQKV